ncbi:DUF262 domain-containing protein [Okibacterium fritillariae]|uniref:GmrSD restriction endonucleases N-terminal domain-containing protein n=1 Tax=Okibacterium fritillariae TaxID=123320 RepID=A0A1T5JF37_9MICO|nr:DUF262 domain-containing protein [Okibacterium fritillariae]SKC49768.1 Protein of unknown function DUF262 [Okibacterium fritillariae]
MTDEVAGVLDRQPTLQAITWLLSLRRFEQLDLNPPYQRKSVWTRGEKQRFLDTIFRNYPSPAIFLHKSLDDEGNPTYHVVDGKQRLSTILDFADNKLRLAKDFGDSRLEGANWSTLADFPAARKTFWNYQLTVEFIDDVHEPLVREIFSRLNQNARKLERQELRHARFDGWLIDFVESQAALSIWKDLRVVTAARSKRMADIQILLEFAQSILLGSPVGFDQDELDALCAAYDDVETAEDFDAEEFVAKFDRAARTLSRLNEPSGMISALAGSRNNLYSLWTYLALNPVDDPEFGVLSRKINFFFAEVERLKQAEKEDPQRERGQDNRHIRTYVLNSAGAATEEPQRIERHSAISAYLQESEIDNAGVLA